MSYRLRFHAILILLTLIISSCAPAATPEGTTATPPTSPATPDSVPSDGSVTPAPSAETTVEPSAEVVPDVMGPDEEDFPPHYNPLTGQPISDLSALGLPAMLVSISNFPPSARPQAGLSFTSYVFEFSITEGATRFLSVFYGDFPKVEIPFMGDCEVRVQPFEAGEGNILGNRVWLDSDQDGLQDFSEPGVGGVCVDLYGAGGKEIARTTTDSNGYYGFNIPAGEQAPDQPYAIEVVQPAGMRFTAFKTGGTEEQDSDVDPATGRMQADPKGTLLSLDAGLIPVSNVTPTPPNPKAAPKAQVGPVRSGRLIYADFANMFQDSCLVYAFASEEVLEKIPTCAMVVHEISGGGSMLPIERMRAIAEDNEKADTQFNYSSNLFTKEPPAGGTPGTQLDVYYAMLNQSGWKYDPLMQSYLRFTDNSDPDTVGQLHPDTDRLNGRQLHFENVIVLFTEHVVISPTNLDIDLAQGGYGPATLFRDGQAYPIRWSTRSGEYEQKTGLRRPIRWENPDGSLAPLKPGHTWVLIVTDFSSLKDIGSGEWKLRYFAPEGAK